MEISQNIALIAVISVVLVGIFTLLLLVFNKLRNLHLMAYRIESNGEIAAREGAALYDQLIARDELVHFIKPAAPLPAMRGWAASPDFLLHIAKYLIQTKAEMIVECSSGVSTLVLARCCQINGRGHVYSLEHDPHYAERTRRSLLEQGLESFASILDAPLMQYSDSLRWYSLDSLSEDAPHIQLLIIDGPPMRSDALARYPALPLLGARFSDSLCAVFLDDADRPAEKATLERWAKEFPEFQQEILSCEKGAAMLTRRRSAQNEFATHPTKIV